MLTDLIYFHAINWLVILHGLEDSQCLPWQQLVGGYCPLAPAFVPSLCSLLCGEGCSHCTHSLWSVRDHVLWKREWSQEDPTFHTRIRNFVPHSAFHLEGMRWGSILVPRHAGSSTEVEEEAFMDGTPLHFGDYQEGLAKLMKGVLNTGLIA